MAIRIEDHEIFLAVRDLVRPAPESETLSSFPLPQRGALGKKAQTKVQQAKQRHYGLFHREFTIKQSYTYRDYVFHIHGRIDGVYQLKDRFEIEEIKSVILTPAAFRTLRIERYPHFSEQLLFYAYLLQDAFNGMEVKTYLILFNLVNNKERIFPVAFQRALIEQKLWHRFEHVIDQIERERRVLQERRRLLATIDFSLPEERPQQKAMMQAVEGVLGEARHLMVSAPTGTGKTAAALFPALRFAVEQGKKVFFVTSKNSQQEIAVRTVQPLIDRGLPLKAMLLNASQTMCLNDVYFCHETYCPFIKNYRERLINSSVLHELAKQPFLYPQTIKAAGAMHRLCPFEIAMDLLPQADIVIGDYNYVFDPAAQLRRLFAARDYRDWILIIDEAHNLYDRGLQYLSPQLARADVQRLALEAGREKSKIFRDLRQALQAADQFFAGLQQEGELHYAHRQYFTTTLPREELNDAFQQFEAAFIRYLIYKIRTRKLIADDPFEQFYYAFRRFRQVARFEDAAFVPYYDAQKGGIVHIQCCDPSGYLGGMIDKFHSVIAMSATLDPMPFYASVLGFSPERTQQLRLDSPFSRRQRKLIIVPDISTRYKDRSRTAPEIARVIKEVTALRPGNYLVFFPSFNFLQLVNLFLDRVPGEKIIQKSAMTSEERDAILNRLKNEAGGHVLLAVMGGVFSEGVDFAGEMAIGVIVISPALPQVTYERELVRHYYDEKNGSGLAYAYIYPGMNKVIQAVGRLIRSAGDRGVTVLIGDRFAQDTYNMLLPDYWFERSGDVVITKDYVPVIREFWRTIDERH